MGGLTSISGAVEEGKEEDEEESGSDGGGEELTLDSDLGVPPASVHGGAVGVV